MSMNVTPILHLNLPPFDSAPWDEDVNDNFLVIDGVLSQVFTVVNFAGVWKNSTEYLQGSEVIDTVDSSFWLCNVTHTSVASPALFSDDRTAHPIYWQEIGTSAADYAQAAADSAVIAGAASATAQMAASAAVSAQTAAEAAAAAAATQVSASVLKTGSTMTGFLVLNADPTTNLQAATKQYVDARVGGVGYVKTSGDTMSGPLVLPGAPTVANQAANKGYVDSTVGAYLPLAGGTVTGDVIVNGMVYWGGRSDTSLGSDGSYAYLNFQAPWRFLFDRGSGTLAYQSFSGANLWYVTGSGDTVTSGVIYGANMYSYATMNTDTLIVRGVADVADNFSAGNILSRGDVGSSSYIYSNNGRIISQSTDGTATVCCHHIGNSAAGMLCSSGILYFQVMDFAGNSLANMAWVSSNGFNIGAMNGGYSQHIWSDSGTSYYDFGANFRWQWNNTSATLAFYSPWVSNFTFVLDPYGSLDIYGNARKPGGGPWNAVSDSRTKTELRPYDDSSLTQLLALRPIWYTYNAASGLHDTTTEHIGLIAQEVEAIMPEMVTQGAGKINDVYVTDLRTLDTTALVYAIINALRELNTRVGALEDA